MTLPFANEFLVQAPVRVGEMGSDAGRLGNRKYLVQYDQQQSRNDYLLIAIRIHMVALLSARRRNVQISVQIINLHTNFIGFD